MFLPHRLLSALTLLVLSAAIPACWFFPYIDPDGLLTASGDSATGTGPGGPGASATDVTDSNGSTTEPCLSGEQIILHASQLGEPCWVYQDPDSCAILLVGKEPNGGVYARRFDTQGQLLQSQTLDSASCLAAAASNTRIGIADYDHGIHFLDLTSLKLQADFTKDGWHPTAITWSSTSWVAVGLDAQGLVSVVLTDEATETATTPHEANLAATYAYAIAADDGGAWIAGRHQPEGMGAEPLLIHGPQMVALPSGLSSVQTNDGLSALLVHDDTVYAISYHSFSDTSFSLLAFPANGLPGDFSDTGDIDAGDIHDLPPPISGIAILPALVVAGGDLVFGGGTYQSPILKSVNLADLNTPPSDLNIQGTDASITTLANVPGSDTDVLVGGYVASDGGLTIAGQKLNQGAFVARLAIQ